eukprot:7136997-Alexandrium_andersonii.AAC.1
MLRSWSPGPCPALWPPGERWLAWWRRPWGRQGGPGWGSTSPSLVTSRIQAWWSRVGPSRSWSSRFSGARVRGPG